MLRRLTLAVLVGSTGACTFDGAPRLEVTVGAIESPAGEGSGEPFLSTDGDAVYLSWIEAADGGGHDLRFARLRGEGFGPAATVSHGARFFVNWADFPSITPGPGGVLWAHWLERGGQGTYDYGVRIVRSEDGGTTWSQPWTPHETVSPTEHGFVSAFPLGDGMGFVWLDGRETVEGPDGAPAKHQMTLRYRSVSADGTPGPDTLVDGRVCDCCQTDVAVASSGPVLVYRDRSRTEIRDIYVSRFDGEGWSEGRPVHEDGWRIPGCPVNGPAVVARGDDVAVAWFTAPEEEARAKVAFSGDGGRSFGAPIQVDDGNPAGRVDLLLLDDGSALVSWLERTGGDAAEVRIRRVRPDGSATASATLTSSSGERASGFPRMVQAPDGRIVLAWTDVMGDEARVRVQSVEIDR